MAGISINLSGNFKKLDDLKDKAGKTAASIKSSFSGMGKALAFTGVAVSATAAFTAIAAGAKNAVAAASDLGEVISKTQAVFKGSADQMMAWADTASRSFGQSKIQALDAASGFGNLFTAMGIGEQSAADMSRRLVELGSDLASFNNTSVAEALEAIGAGVRGEAEPMRKFGVLMNDATLRAQALASGISDGTSALDPAQKALAAYQLILSKTTTAQGDFQKTSDGLANTQRTITALVSDMGAEIGKGLLPTVQSLANELKAVDFQAVGRDIGDLTEGVVGMVSALSKLVAMIPQVQLIGKISGFAGSMNPMKGTALEMPGVTIGADGVAVLDSPAAGAETGKSPQPPGSSGMATVAAPGSGGLAEAMAKAKAEAKAAAESRAAALDEYNMDSAILSAKLAGDAKRLEALEREKKIREEMKRLEAAGFTAGEARTPATAKVDAESKIAANADAKERAADEKKRIADILAGRLQDVQGRQKSHQFQSTIGAASSMQRIGGGGGAVSSGLDYARQAADLQRESNDLQREMVALLRPALD